MPESIRIKETDLSLGELESLLKDVEADLFKKEKKRITGLTLADPNGPDRGHNVIVIDASATPPPEFGLRQFAVTQDEEAIARQIIAVEDEPAKKQLRCYGTVLVSDQPAIVALFDPAPAASVLAAGTILVKGKMSTFGGPNDPGMGEGENLAWIEDEKQAAGYPGFFLPKQGSAGFGRRLVTSKFYLACRWDYSVTPKNFLAQPTTLCTVKNPATGQSEQARPIDWGPDEDVTHGRVADLSPGLATALGLPTDAICEVVIPTPKQPVARVAPTGGAGGKRQVVFLIGDYTPNHVRQRQAQAAGCAFTVDFHFNSNGSTAKGGEVYFRADGGASKAAAERLIAGFNAIGLSDHGDPVKAAAGTRAGFIEAYQNTAVLLEPLFVSNPDQAHWLHDSGNFNRLAQAIADAVTASTQPGDVIGLSIGHLGKDSSPSDRGADCQKGDTEAAHGEALAHAVADLLRA